MRVYLMFALILGVMALSARQWFVALCGLLVLAALSQHEDMPRAIGGIPGLSPDNVLLGWTMLMWFLQRRATPPAPPLPRTARILVGAYIGILVLAFVRGVLDLDSIQGPYRRSYASFAPFTIEFLIDPLKYLVPALLIYLGTSTRSRLLGVLGALLVMALLYAFMVIKNLPLNTLLDEDLFMARRHRIARQTGLHANDMALVMVQAFWAVVVYFRAERKRLLRAGAVGAAVALGLSAALCHSRGGYLAFVATGVTLGAVCWRRLLLLIPPAVVVVCLAFPTILTRMLTGVGETSPTVQRNNDWDAISAGRTTILWPAALNQITESPLFGYGRLAILRTAMYEPIAEGEDQVPTHPHNAYLEMLCDGGIVALAVVLAGMLCLMRMSTVLGRDKSSETARLVGGTCLVSVTAMAVMAISGQSFWPRENALLTACLIGLTLRAWTMRTAPVAATAVAGRARRRRESRRPNAVRQPLGA